MVRRQFAFRSLFGLMLTVGLIFAGLKLKNPTLNSLALVVAVTAAVAAPIYWLRRC